MRASRTPTLLACVVSAIVHVAGQASQLNDFVLVDEPLMWQAARDTCRKQFHGDLASVHSRQEQDEVGSICSNASSYGTEGTDTAEANFYKACWIGLSDVNVRNWACHVLRNPVYMLLELTNAAFARRLRVAGSGQMARHWCTQIGGNSHPATPRT